MADVQRIQVAGREHLRISSDQLQLELVPSLGGTIVSLRRRHPAGSDEETGRELLWRPRWGHRPVGAAVLPGSTANVSTDTFLGGWFSMFPNGSESTVVEGADWPANGEARLTWCDWEQTNSSVILTGQLVRSPFQFTKTVSVQGEEVTVGETVTNVGNEHVDVVWGSQLMFDAELFGLQTRFDSRATLVRSDARQTPSAGYDDILPWPRSYAAEGLVNLRSLPDPRRGEVSRAAYLSDFGAAEASLISPEHGFRVDLSWDGDTWPYLWYQLETGGRTGYPWWGAASYLALTPSSSWPAAGVGEIRRISATSLRIHPGAVRTAHLSLRLRDA